MTQFLGQSNRGYVNASLARLSMKCVESEEEKVVESTEMFYQLSCFIEKGNHCTVFQLGIFLRALRPARTVLRPARIIFKKKNSFIFQTNF